MVSYIDDSHKRVSGIRGAGSPSILCRLVAMSDTKSTLDGADFEGKSRFLPFDENPIYKTYLDTIYALGITNARFDMRSALSVSYVNLAATPPALMLPGACPLYIVPWNTIDRFTALGYLQKQEPGFDLMVTSHKSILEWIVDRICDDNYVYATVNEQHLPGTLPHAKGVPFTHPCLLTACDGSRGCFTAYTYRVDGTFGAITPSFTETALALTERGDKTQMRDTYFFEPVLCSVGQNQAFASYSFDQQAVRKVLREYISCQPSNNELSGGEFYGSSAVTHVLGQVAESVNRSLPIDLRGTRVLMEQRNIMTGNIEYISENVHVPELRTLRKAYQEVANWAKSLHLLSYDRLLRRRKALGNDQIISKHLSAAQKMMRLDAHVMEALAVALDQ